MSVYLRIYQNLDAQGKSEDATGLGKKKRVVTPCKKITKKTTLMVSKNDIPIPHGEIKESEVRMVDEEVKRVSSDSLKQGGVGKEGP